MLQTTEDSVLTFQNNGELKAIVWLDQANHHHIFYEVKEMGNDEIKRLYEEK